ncbi:murein DD-endopeptidase MepM/ murein hydrolase activator NlpD [Paramicrobacterium agarici]|nr:murein DD-endopeptidase MepM/ murein hydrolase activator NlpD [Microbacterium agarici]
MPRHALPDNVDPVQQTATVENGRGLGHQRAAETRRGRRTHAQEPVAELRGTTPSPPGPRRIRRAAERSIENQTARPDLASIDSTVARSGSFPSAPGQAASVSPPGNDRRRPHRPRRRRTAGLLSVSAVVAVGALTVATSMPADALASVQGTKNAPLSRAISASEATLPSQSLVNDASSKPAFSRDTYSAGTVTTGKNRSYNNDSVGSQSNARIQWPFAPGSFIGSDFGPRAGCSIGCSTYHLGQDFTPGYGTPIKAVADGVVVQSSDYSGGFGVKIVIEHRVDGRTVRSLYAHMKRGSRQVQVGARVAAGQVIADVGNSGISTGPHLHLEILLDGTRNVDPLAWLSANAG